MFFYCLWNVDWWLVIGMWYVSTKIDIKWISCIFTHTLYIVHCTLYMLRWYNINTTEPYAEPYAEPYLYSKFTPNEQWTMNREQYQIWTPLTTLNGFYSIHTYKPLAFFFFFFIIRNLQSSQDSRLLNTWLYFLISSIVTVVIVLVMDGPDPNKVKTEYECKCEWFVNSLERVFFYMCFE